MRYDPKFQAGRSGGEQCWNHEQVMVGVFKIEVEIWARRKLSFLRCPPRRSLSLAQCPSLLHPFLHPLTLWLSKLSWEGLIYFINQFFQRQNFKQEKSGTNSIESTHLEQTSAQQLGENKVLTDSGRSLRLNPALPLTSFVAFGDLHNTPEPQFPNL